ncbi:hypothetical protein BU23DRAFT_557909 [Bimuria novae-zelandiae CBS 107.79]|uniref:F-box domain-containing protein n=1 Tax=Bimuria novae-zelandiae CBS 107.79 TaxID=1447943 RepID=A0A6A5UWR8_9PLEO|nr:hypothetical protein BU23DRAFT_557909 [Bimuria novae-zelandiae CBS 107.79]
MAFSDLSVDLIYVIFSHLQSDQAELHSLALSCRQFRDIAQRFMVRDASITHSIKGSRAKLFLRTLLKRPDLVSHVHRLKFDLLREDIHWPEEQQIIHQITRRLTNLREFCYLSRDYKFWHYSVPLPLKWERDHAHDQVRRVEWHHNMAPWELRKCMELPRIEAIYVLELQDISSGRFTSFKVPARKHKTSTLAELRLGSPDEMAYQSLNMLLHLPKSLKKIAFEARSVHQSALAPTALVLLLEPARDTLEELHLEIYAGKLGPPSRPADLSAFVSLTKLSLPFRYIFAPVVEVQYHADAHLPTYLQELEITFIPDRNSPDPATTKYYDALIGWLRTIDGQHEVPLRMPSLTRVTLRRKDHLSVGTDLPAERLQEVLQGWRSQSEGLAEGRLIVDYHH